MTAPAPAAIGLATGERALTEAAAATAAAIGEAPELLESDVPTIETAAYQRSLPRWQKCRDVYQGTEAIRAGTTKYLPRFAGETATLYNARRTIAGFFNGYERAIDANVGLLVDPEPVLGADMPEKLKAMWENADGAGTHGAVQSRALVTAGMVDGFTGLFVEYPRADDPRIDRSKASLAATEALRTGAELDAADVEALGLRPYLIVMKADEVLPVYETVNGKRTLVLFIRRESVTERKGRFGLKTVTRYRVYELKRGEDGAVGVFFELWTVPSVGGPPTKTEGPTLMRNLTGIPWSPLIAGKKLGENEYKPTMIDLADLNLTHHRIATGILSLEEQAFVPTPVRIGCPPNEDGTYPELVTGPASVIEVPVTEGMPNEPVYYLSPPVDVLEPGMKSLETNKAEMGAMGAQFLTPEPRAAETAEAHRIDASAERATIGSVSRAFQDCLEAAFGFAAQYIGEKAGSVAVNKDFLGEGIDPQMVAQMTAAYLAGGLSLPEYRHFLKTGQLPETFDAEDTRAILAGQRTLPDGTSLDDGNGGGNDVATAAETPTRANPNANRQP
jgi:hypothetical protein